MRLLAAAVFAGLALIAGAVVYHTLETRDPDLYADAEEIVTRYLNAVGEPAQSVSRVSGPFVLARFGPGECALIDVSTQYEDQSDRFWLAAGSESGDC